ncbi:peptide chain release factor 2 [Paraconexibacter sp.]|uniref:peptide chain release factor 2 n=1 Tax=Paraconexibacter sp. TaxID=2949640 RepID=UPI0035627D9F
MSTPSSTEPTPQRLQAIAAQLAELRDHLQPDALARRLEELEAEMGASGFWDDQDRAPKVSAEHARTTRRLDAFRALQRDAEDLEGLAELADEDDEIAAELEEQITSVQSRLAELEEARLFSGKYDAGDALVTINSGAGGTDAQDWAEMLLRMQMRWAESRGFSVELLEVSEGTEAGITSATFRASGENAYGLFNAEKGVHRLVRISPFDSQNRRQTAFAGLEVAPIVDEVGDVSIEPDDLRVDTYRASGAGGQHVNKTDSAVRITHVPTGVVVQCQNERSQSSNRETAMKMLRAKLLERAEQERKAEIAKAKGESEVVGWGSQIRSYVLQPYTMVKDHRTGHEVGDAAKVLEGDLDGFVRAELLRAAGKAPTAEGGSDEV